SHSPRRIPVPERGRSSMSRTPSSIVSEADPGDADRWMLPVAVMTIVVSLALLVAVPIAVEWQIGRIRWERIGRVDVAEREVNELAFTLAREMALLRGFLFDGDTLLLRSYSAMRDHEENVVSILGGLDPLLAPPLSGL